MSEAVLAVSKHNGQVLCTCLWSKPSPEEVGQGQKVTNEFT